ncbi:hypothetical protein NLM33_43695 [Bradyrhizobium sp. CCGUVB1N3]|uniref:hypothetical protein n=1 Tax=Bradyrhizobium sp. CCGUVB1N3 TaxID=2949629 RepID=UPI0020B30F88|nr:hypothetical protein [Bradyrhizobium sp. CCGUVB1N3]MCP3477065.1 hypothetical protein [Bradyrhizobium sp. CCGUVB1N3]
MMFRRFTGKDSVVPRQESTFISDLAVIYLARYAEGTRPVMNFIESFERHSPGIAHDRVVIRKGFPSRKTALDQSLARAFPHSVSLSDDGFDIAAYAEAAAQLPHRRVVFLNTFSEIVADGWLRKLDSAFADTEVGIAGATGSYESPLSSMKHVQKGWWLFQNKGIPNPAGTLRLLQAIRRRLPKWLATKLMSIAISYFSARSSRANCDQTLDDRFETYWANQIGPGGALARLKDMKVFPNPHIRTNAFMIERKLFLDVLPDSIETKNDSYLFENGPDGLTQQILRRGMKAVVVGANGRVYAMEEWGDSGTFRLGDQHNLLVKDNQTRAFQNMTAAERRAFTSMTWGDDRSPRQLAGPGRVQSSS